MTIREWIREREINGMPTFSFEKVRLSFVNMSEQIIKNELLRLSMQKKIISVYRGFYVIIPPHYASKGVVPPLYYIDQLMTFIEKPYYISLLNAAELLGAAHQRPQRFSVTTIYPKPTVSTIKNNTLSWIYRNDIPQAFISSKNSETGIIYYSNAELTAIDLVQYERHVGGFSRVATVLEELAEQLNFDNSTKELFNYTSLATIQRLGYILDEVLQQTEIAEKLYEQLCKYTDRFRYVPLSIKSDRAVFERNSHWKINVNQEIETDDI